MRTRVMAVSIALVGWVAFAGCNTEAGYDGTHRDSKAGTESRVPADAQAQAQHDRATGDTTGAEAGFGAYDQWDADHSGDVTKTEFDSRFASFPGWSTWDLNDDQSLDQKELATWFAGEAWDDWDRDGDGKVARNEAAEAMWSLLDEDHDNKVDQEEWNHS